MVKPELHLQGSSQAAHFSSMNPSFSKAAASPPLQQNQRPHPMSQPSNMSGNPHLSQTQGASHSSPHQQPYPMHLAKERQFQNRMVSQQHNDLSVPSMVPGVQRGPQIQQQNLASPIGSTASLQPPQPKQQSASQNPPDSSALHNQPANATEPKQKKQPGQQQTRQNQQQRNQASQQAKLMKSLGRGNVQIAQTSAAVDATPASAVSTASKKQASSDKKNLVQHAQGPSAVNKAPISVTPHAGNQHKLYTAVHRSPSPDIGNQGLMQGPPGHTILASRAPPVHSKFPVATQQQRQINPSQNSAQRLMMQQNVQMKPDHSRIDGQIDQAQHTQVTPTTAPISHGTEPGSPGVPFMNQHKHQASGLAAVTSTSEPLISPKGNFAGNESPSPSSSQGMLQRQLSGGPPPMQHGQDSGGLSWHQQQLSGGPPPMQHGQDAGGLSWHQQQFRQPPHHQQPQHQQRPVAPGGLYPPSNSGSG